MVQTITEFLAEYWHLLLAGLIVLQAGSLALAVLSERREPAATFAWLMTVTFLPLIGVIAYYALARTRFRHQFRAKAQVNRQADEALSMYVHERLGDFDEAALSHLGHQQQGLIALAANSAQSSGGSPPSNGNAVEVCFDPAVKYDRLKEAIRAAESHVHLEYYIFRGDRTGREIRDLLVERAEAGVEVRLLLDGVGSLGTYRPSFFDSLRAAGGEVATFLPARFARFIERVNFRNHRKIAVIDGRVGFLGGMNIGDDLLGANPRLGKWHDSHLRIAGPAVAELQRIFLTDWLFTTNASLAEPRYFPEIKPAGDELVQIVISGPDCRWPTIQQIYLQALATSEEQVLIANPYFVPDRSMLSALEMAALRGVDVRLLLPSKSDVRLVTSAARSYYEELLEAGVRVFEYRGGFLHAKTLAVDGRYGSVGSANMDIRSFELNFEVSAFVFSEPFARGLREQFDRDVEQAVEIDLESFRRRPRLRRFGQRIAQLLSGIL
jgi:cardiolipin synthase